MIQKSFLISWLPLRREKTTILIKCLLLLFKKLYWKANDFNWNTVFHFSKQPLLQFCDMGTSWLKNMYTVILRKIPDLKLKIEKKKENWHTMFHYTQAGTSLWRSIWEGWILWWKCCTNSLFTPSALIHSYIQCLQIQDVTSLSLITQRFFQVVFLTFMWYKRQRYLVNGGRFSKDVLSTPLIQ